MTTTSFRTGSGAAALTGLAVAAALASLLVLPCLAGAVQLSQLPLSAKSQATPNIIFGVDDSGSMDWEVLSPASGGQYYWQDGQGFYNGDAIRNSGNNAYAYLFPNGYSNADTSDVKKYNDDNNYAAVPPTAQLAFVRSASYNPMYYDPAKTYVPWAPAWIGSKLETFRNADPENAFSHPYFPTPGQGAVIDLTRILYSENTAWTFRLRKGMTLRGIVGKIPGDSAEYRARTLSGSTWTERDAGWTATSTVSAGIPYFPATYWAIESDPARSDSDCEKDDDCAIGPDGRQLRRIEIRPDSPAIVDHRFPSGRSYAQEIQNFANWFQYYRKRKLLLAAAMSSALADIKGIRGGTSNFNENASSKVAMYDFSTEADSQNGRVVLGAIYRNRSNSGTPTGTKLDFIGKQFKRSDSTAPIQYACQRNAAFILTDGYANGSNPSTPSYDRSSWHGASPYTKIYSNSLADLAASYYTNNLRPDLTTGLLSIDPTDTSPNADRNTDLHMQTFAITLGALGQIYGTNTPPARNPFVNPPNWPTPKADEPSSIDDLWHATINGRGEMYAAFNAQEVTEAMREVVRKILVAAGSDAGIAVSTVNLRAGDNTAFVSSYNARNWTGDVAAYPIDIATGGVDATRDKAIWSAAALLDKRTPGSRIIASHDGSKGVPFTAAGLGARMSELGASDGADVLAWIRGNRSREGTVYRERASLLGDIVSAEPVYHEGVLYQPANDGMVHAFDAATGQELWAYVPGSVIPRLRHLTDPEYEHEFFVDGTPTVAKIPSGGGGSTTLLIGGMRGGGPGYYAIDITQPRFASESALAAKVKWEFPDAHTSPSDRSKMGASFGKPVVVKTSAGWVVLLTTGYNNLGGGRLYVLDALTGKVINAINTSGSGLGQVSAWSDDPSAPDAIVDTVYGGDLDGNLWRFDLSGKPADWTAVALLSLGTAKPIMSAPELARIGDARGIFFGTGQLLSEADMTDNRIQSVYGVIDRGPGSEIKKPATQLLKQTVSVAAGGIRNISNTAVDWNKYAGWYFDLPGGERMSTDPSVAFGALTFTSNKPSPSACATESFLYAVSLASGGQLPTQNFNGQTPWSGRRLGFSYSSRPVIVTLPSGKVVAITHKSDTAIDSSLLPIGGQPSLRRLGWREVMR